MFYKATENASGSGLGLYIAMESIHKLGGHIGLESIELPQNNVDKIS